MRSNIWRLLGAWDVFVPSMYAPFSSATSAAAAKALAPVQDFRNGAAINRISIEPIVSSLRGSSPREYVAVVEARQWVAVPTWRSNDIFHPTLYPAVARYVQGVAQREISEMAIACTAQENKWETSAVRTLRSIAIRLIYRGDVLPSFAVRE